MFNDTTSSGSRTGTGNRNENIATFFFNENIATEGIGYYWKKFTLPPSIFVKIYFSFLNSKTG
jgi:hypothetical protein